MVKVSRFIDAPFQGISQAPNTSRLDEQVERAINGIVLLPDGLTKRPPLDRIARLDLTKIWRADGLFELIAGKNFALHIQLEGGTAFVPRVFDLATFTEQTLNISAAAQTYLNTGVGGTIGVRDFRIVTIADTTFIANKQVTVANGTATQATRPFEALVWVRQSEFARKYKLTVTKTAGTPRTGEYKTPTGATQASNEFIDTDKIVSILLSATAGGVIPDGGVAIGELKTDLETDGFTVTVLGSVIHLSHPTVDFTVVGQDGQGGAAMEVIKSKVPSFGRLPQRAVEGFTVKIVQDSASELDDFFVKFETSAGSTEGTWKETIAPGANLGVNPNTLPLVLTQNPGTGVWSLDVGAWKGRQTGDEFLDLDPEFIGEKLEDVTFWKGRLVFIFRESIALSASDDPFLFYRKTLATFLASDTFGLTSPFEKISLFRYGLTFDTQLLIFSDLAQLKVISKDGLTSAETTSIDTTSQYAFEPRIRPQAANSRVYFVTPKGLTQTSVFELSIDAITDIDEADDLSLAIPTLLPSQMDRVTTLAASYLAIYGKSGTSALFAHVFRYAERQRVQNGWFQWQLPEGLVTGGMFFGQDSKLYIMAIEAVAGNDVGHVFSMDISPARLDPDPASRYLTLLDDRRTEAVATPVYTAVTDTTAIPLLMDGTVTGREVVVVARAPGGTGGIKLGGTLQPIAEGTPATISSVTPSSVIVKGDWTAVPFWVGFEYTLEVILNRFFMRGQDGKPFRGAGRVSMRQFIVDLSDSGFIEVKVKRGNRKATIHQFQGYIWGDSESLYGVSPSTSTDFRVALGAKAEETEVSLLNSSWFPSRVTGYTWVAEFNPKTRNA